MRLIVTFSVLFAVFAVSAWFLLDDPDSGETAFPGANGKIAFEKDGVTTNFEDVYVMNADGTNEQPLADSPSSDGSPAWSPDGTKIAFRSDRDGDSEIYVMSADGSGQTNLTNFASANDFDPSWSPDGTMIAFQSSRGDGTNIVVMNEDGSAQTNITNAAPGDTNGAPAWSPDGSRIAFLRGQGNLTDIYLMDPDGSDLEQLTHTTKDRDPAWSADGTMIAFRSDRDGDSEIYVMNANGSGQTNITSDPATDVDPAWSPDGTKILFRTNRDDNEEIYSMNPDGSEPVRLTNDDDDVVDARPDWQAVLPSPTPTPTQSPVPSATATPGPQLAQGDNNCDGKIQATDALAGLQQVAGLPVSQQPDCPALGGALPAALPAGDPPTIFGDVDCDNDADAVDALTILKFVAALPFTQNEPCTDIGDSL